MRLGDCCRRLCQPTAEGVPDGMAAGCFICLLFGPASARIPLGLTAAWCDLTAFSFAGLSDRRDHLYLPTAVGVPDGMAAEGDRRGWLC